MPKGHHSKGSEADDPKYLGVLEPDTATQEAKDLLNDERFRRTRKALK